MRIYRISHFADLGGEGGRRASARWHHKGRPVVYCASNAAAAMLEAIAYIARGDPSLLPSTFQLLEIELPDSMNREIVSLDQLPADWKQHLSHTRSIGDKWLGLQATAVLVVPSALAPDTKNFLLNPAHPDLLSPGQGNVRIVRVQQYPFDSRLFEGPVRKP
jgi:RES domain-containing protein